MSGSQIIFNHEKNCLNHQNRLNHQILKIIEERTNADKVMVLISVSSSYLNSQMYRLERGKGTSFIYNLLIKDYAISENQKINVKPQN